MVNQDGKLCVEGSNNRAIRDEEKDSAGMITQDRKVIKASMSSPK